MLSTLLNRVFNGLAFYTRLPCPKFIEYSDAHLNRASAFFPLIGTLLAGLLCGALYFLSPWFPIEISIALIMIISILLTGAFHEDGFADLCDGFGGGWHTKDVLRIMKDSRLGTYGVIGLVFVLLLKWLTLSSMALQHIFVALLISYTLSRSFAISLIMLLPYVQEDQSSKAKPIAKAWFKSDMAFAWASALLVSSWLNWQLTLILMVIGCVHLVWIRHWFAARLGGYTGDALGASQQVFEISFYLAMCVYFGT